MHNSKKKQGFPPWPQLFIFIFTWQTLERVSIWSIHECLGGKNGSRTDSYWDIVIIHGNHNCLEDILCFCCSVFELHYEFMGWKRQGCGFQKPFLSGWPLWRVVNQSMVRIRRRHGRIQLFCKRESGMPAAEPGATETLWLNMSGNMASLRSIVTALHGPVFVRGQRLCSTCPWHNTCKWMNWLEFKYETSGRAGPQSAIQT